MKFYITCGNLQCVIDSSCFKTAVIDVFLHKSMKNIILDDEIIISERGFRPNGNAQNGDTKIKTEKILLITGWEIDNSDE